MVAKYSGGFHCELTHEPSGSGIETDAPKDNMGKGERFSPTDLVGAALVSCILTTMAIVAERDGISLRGATAEVTKEMVLTPSRRVGSLSVRVHFPAGIPQSERKRLEKVGTTCPVQQSLHPDVKTSVLFSYED